jgi:ribosome-associated protein
LNLDIKKLQRAIVDGLEDMKGHNIVVFNTEHLSPLFERVVIASGTSNRQTKALAQGVRDSVKKRGMQVLRTEGEDNGEWIIVDCGAAVVHLMQPSIRDYYHLEEIWGDKPVKMKLDTAPVRLVKASEPEPAPTAKKAAAKRVPAKKAAAKKSPASSATPRAAAPAAKRAAPAKSAGARPAAPRRAGVTSTSGVTRTVGVKTAPAKAPAKTSTKVTARAPAKSAARAPTKTPPKPTSRALVARQPAAKAAPARKAAPAKSPARKTSGRG